MTNGTAVEGVVAFLGVGSNMNGAVEPCREAVRRVEETPGIRLLRTSSWYRTEPVGRRNQDWFVNAVVEIRTVHSARALLTELRAIEAAMGRTNVEKWGPRIIDLDILLYGDDIVQEDDLIIPHPELHRRRFVLVPLCELASYMIHPAFGVSMQGLLSRLEDQSTVERL